MTARLRSIRAGGRRTALLLLAALLAPLAGCNAALVGDWRLVHVSPSRHVFSMDEVTFRSDGTFTAQTIIDGVPSTDTGRYEYNGFKLRLHPAAGGQRKFDALLRVNRLELSAPGRRIVLAKGQRSGS